VENSEVIRQVWAEIGPLLESNGYELIEAEVAQMGAQRVLRLYIDKPEGVTIDDCTAASRIVNPYLDETELFEGRYLLEMSSPGIARPIRKPEHFERYSGEAIKLQTHTPLEGRRKFSGILRGYEDGLVTVECDGACFPIHEQNIKKAYLDC